MVQSLAAQSTPDSEADATASAGQLTPEDWAAGSALLASMLREGSGIVSSLALRTALEKLGCKNARSIVVALKYHDFNSPTEEGFARPELRWYSHARSLYSEEAYQRLQRDREADASSAEQEVEQRAEANPDIEVPAQPTERRRNRQEESRLGAYVKSALENIYESEASPDKAERVFDVHNGRAGGDYENVDLLAVHWRSERIAEIVTVEVKLEFTARLVQQAKNYARFSDRVWIAVPVGAEASEVSEALREFDPLLFEHVIEVGLGILACRRRPGRSYEVIPVQWPRKMQVDPVEREAFIERYRETFEEACVVPPQSGKRYPSLM